MVLHATRCQASAELYMGLVEVGVGLIPGGGGCKELLLRLKNPQKVFELAGMAKVSTSAEDARNLGLLNKADAITMNNERLVADAAADVVVTVSATGDVTCTPDPVVVKATKSTLVFRLATPGWVFRAENAIVVAQPGTEFPEPSKTAPGGLKATLMDRDRSVGSFAYTVTVVQPSTGRVGSVDPTIENQPN